MRSLIGKIVVMGLVSFVFLDGQSAAALDKKAAAKARKAAASRIGINGALSKKSPSVAKVFAKGKNEAGSKTLMSHAHLIGTLATGNVPPMPDLPGIATQTFWPNGEINALNTEDSPSQQVCGDFWGGVEEGSSGGMNACFLTESSGRSIEELLRSATSVCYMSKFPTAPSGVELVSGEYPDGGAKNLFKPDDTQDRLVKVNVTGFEEGSQTIFIRIFSKANNGGSNQYKHELYFCGEGATPDEIESLEIGNNGKYTSSHLGSAGGMGGTFTSSLEAFITSSSNGKISFDTTKSRFLDVQFNGGSGDYFKSRVEVTPTNFIKAKTLEDHGGEGARSGYQVSKFSGSDVSNLKILEGGSKDSNGYSGIVEFLNDGYYASSNSAIQSMLNQVDVDSDPFYAEEPSVDTSLLTQYDCTADADVELNLNMSDPGLSGIAAQCEGVRLDGMDYCHSGEIQDAMDNFFSKCMGG